MCRCWAQEPVQRPSFGDVVTELRGTLGTAIGGME
eukprot:COSAG01_NODE_1992_length_8696_cov_4.370827_3_plen_35_part_00